MIFRLSIREVNCGTLYRDFGVQFFLNIFLELDIYDQEL
ncbi:hypothetical protein TPHV1_60060 [Treponema phagedenis]|uniref:Uncharacterized protein n=1 Tax=Treponema phagedenis TaxID=162 RepID=A0A0B7GZK5_TREPH|nr:hypothetical protein TPHV1_60060 [Treponema phagedenis]